MISDHPIIKKMAWTSGTRRAGASMETHREYVGYLDEWDGAERLTDEEVVRCRDCRYYDQNDEPSEVYPDRYLCDLMANFLHPDGFCAWGERRDA